MASELVTLIDTERAGNLNPIQAQRLAELRASGSQGHPEGIHQYPGAPEFGQYGGGGAPSQPLTFNQPTIDLPKLYESLYTSSGIKDEEAGLSTKTNTYNEQVAKIKDNPYLSEATLTGRISKLTDKFRADETNIRND